MKSNRIRNRMRDMKDGFFNNHPEIKYSNINECVSEVIEKFIAGVPDELLLDALKIFSSILEEQAEKIDEFIKNNNEGISP